MTRSRIAATSGIMTVMTTHQPILPAGHAPDHLPTKVTDLPKDYVRLFPHNKRVGNYLLGKTLGEGSFAKVKEGLHLLTGERVAVKVVDKKRAKADAYVRKNMRREGRILQMCQHPNIVRLYEVMETENCYYLVTELCKGGDFMDYICKKKKLEEREVKKYMKQIISAVDYLHRQGVLHRDLKVENLLLDENKDIKIIDFGLSNCVKTAVGKDERRVQEMCNTQCGSPAYAAPELLSHQKYGPQVDIWSIGVNMYAMLTGNLPFTVEPFNIKTLHSKMINGLMNPVPDSLSKDGKDFLKRMLCPDPDARMTFNEAMSHPWIAESKEKPMDHHPCPNRLHNGDLSQPILQHMAVVQGFNISESTRYLIANTPSAATAAYHLWLLKMQRYDDEVRTKGRLATFGTILSPTKDLQKEAADRAARRERVQQIHAKLNAKTKTKVGDKPDNPVGDRKERIEDIPARTNHDHERTPSRRRPRTRTSDIPTLSQKPTITVTACDPEPTRVAEPLRVSEQETRIHSGYRDVTKSRLLIHVDPVMRAAQYIQPHTEQPTKLDGNNNEKDQNNNVVDKPYAEIHSKQVDKKLPLSPHHGIHDITIDYVTNVNLKSLDDDKRLTRRHTMYVDKSDTQDGRLVAKHDTTVTTISKIKDLDKLGEPKQTDARKFVNIAYTPYARRSKGDPERTNPHQLIARLTGTDRRIERHSDNNGRVPVTRQHRRGIESTTPIDTQMTKSRIKERRKNVRNSDIKEVSPEGTIESLLPWSSDSKSSRSTSTTEKSLNRGSLMLPVISPSYMMRNH